MTMGDKRTFAAEIEKIADGEPIIGIVIAKNHGWGGGDEGTHRADVVLTWDEARPTLDYTYHNGYGVPDCHPITAWTESRVIFVHEYDGSTSLHYLPRNPVDHEPEHSGIYDV